MGIDLICMVLVVAAVFLTRETAGLRLLDAEAINIDGLSVKVAVRYEWERQLAESPLSFSDDFHIDYGG